MRFTRFQAAMPPLWVILVTILATVSLQGAAHSQTVSGMTGVVTDQSGAAVPNAAVILKNTARGLKFSANTNAIGFYRFSEIPPGQGYEAVFTAPGFAPLEVTNII